MLKNDNLEDFIYYASKMDNNDNYSNFYLFTYETFYLNNWNNYYNYRIWVSKKANDVI